MHIPGASIAVIDKGKIIWAKGFGYADLKTRRKVNEHTLFQAASITKTLTAAALLKLLNDKNIYLDEPVNRYLKPWQIPENKYTKTVPVTFRLLLNHTAAISNPYPDGGYGPNQTLPSLIEVYQGKKPATNPPLTVTRVPGSHFEYCNGCYAILQGAMEAIAKQPYPKLMASLILKPANMADSQFNNDLYKTKPSMLALPYDPEGKRYFNAPTRSPIYATGLLWSTPTDLAKFNIAITKALQENNSLLPKSLALSLITPSQTPIHGLGYFIGDRDADTKPCGRYIFHTGSNIGYLSLSIISTDGQQGAVILINISPGWQAKAFPQFNFVKGSLKLIANYYDWA